MSFEFYATPHAFTRYLFHETHTLGYPISGTAFEPCVGDGAILKASKEAQAPVTWLTNDLDTRWPADFHESAARGSVWEQAARLPIDWTITNPPFTSATSIIEWALMYSQVGVAMHLRASIHEVLRRGGRRVFLHDNPPTGILWLPRFAFQRSSRTGKWTTDSVCTCWVIWLKDRAVPQFIRYTPESVIDALNEETPAYRARMDALAQDKDLQ